MSNSPAPFLQSQLGDYMLVAQLGEDSLGTVYRALYAADERRFVRLRVLQSAELSHDDIARAIEENALRGAMVHDAIVARAQFDEVEGVPFMTWDETSGWTLDAMLERVRILGIRIPAEYALLITERIAAALEHAHQTEVDGRPSDHGLLWPGFVSISHDAAVRVGGFGVADGVLPSITSPRLLADIGPYVAPEVRCAGLVGANADVYSLGAILIELLTGRRPSLDTPSAELRAGDPRSEELEAFLRRCLAPAADRFESAIDAHRALQQIVTGNPFSLYTANLALFLYKLLNPESQAVAKTSDMESTNPVVVHGPVLAAEPAVAAAPPLPGTPRRRRGDAVPDEEPLTPMDVPVTVAAMVEPVPTPEDLWIEAPVAAEPAPPAQAAPAASTVTDLSAARRNSLPPLPPLARAWARPFAALATAAAVALGAFFVASQVQSGRESIRIDPPGVGRFGRRSGPRARRSRGARHRACAAGRVRALGDFSVPSCSGPSRAEDSSGTAPVGGRPPAEGRAGADRRRANQRPRDGGPDFRRRPLERAGRRAAIARPRLRRRPARLRPRGAPVRAGPAADLAGARPADGPRPGQRAPERLPGAVG